MQEAFDLSYNITALCAAILRDDIATVEQAFNAIDDKQLRSVYNEQDTVDMAKMKARGLTYREIGEIYGLHKDCIYSKVKNYKEKISQTAI